MEKPKKPAGRPRGQVYHHRFLVYEDDEGIRLIEKLMQRRGQGRSALIRALVRETAKREGIE